jgi:hypothetical protein
MTHKQLIQKLIEHYQFGIDNLPMEDWDDFLIKNKLAYGICFCAQKKFETHIYYHNFIETLTQNQSLICRYPYSEPREKALEYLQIRLNALKSIDLKTLKDE